MTNQGLNDLLARFEGSSLSKLKLSTQEFTIETVSYTHLTLPTT